MTREVGPPRGVLRAGPEIGVFHHARIAPSEDLEALVQHYWSVRWDLRGAPPEIAETLPHPNVHVVFEPEASRVHGLSPGRFSRVLAGAGGVFGVKFRPGGFRGLLGRAVSSLRGRVLPLREVFGDAGDAWAAAVLAQRDDGGRVAAAETFLRACGTAPDADALLAGEIVDAIAQDHGLRTVEDLVARWRLAPRSLQRLFREYVGIGPKWVINRYRLHEALARIDAGAVVDWAALAADLGYFDQAHFIRDFKALVGKTPAQYARGRPTTTRGDRTMWQYTGRERPPFAIAPGPGQESVWDYPRPPRLAPDARRVLVRAGDAVVADSRRAIRVLETASPPTFYLPPEDVDTALLRAAPGGSHCEWKGRAAYWSLALDDGRVFEAVAWSYPQPTPAFAAIAGWLSFYPARLACSVDGERVRAQPGGFYGGWVTDEIVGPFKGEPGTSGW